MRTIWKFPIRDFSFSLSLSLSLSAGWRAVLVGKQDGQAHIWIEHLAEEGERETAHFQVFGTGQKIPMSARWLGSWLDAPFVWHLYQVDHDQD